jgi:hypothetical protein
LRQRCRAISSFSVDLGGDEGGREGDNDEDEEGGDEVGGGPDIVNRRGLSSVTKDVSVFVMVVGESECFDLI